MIFLTPGGRRCINPGGEGPLRHSPRGSTVARLGGDEFAVLLDYEDVSSVLDFAELIRAELLKDALLSKRGITASIGVAASPKDGPAPKQLAAAQTRPCTNQNIAAETESQWQGTTHRPVARPRPDGLNEPVLQNLFL